MKTYLGLLVLVPATVFGQAAAGNAPEKWSGNATLKALGNDKGGFGIDYKFRFDPFKTESSNMSGGLSGSGFITTDSSTNTANAVTLNATFDYENEFNLPAGWSGTQPSGAGAGGAPAVGSVVSVPGSVRVSALAKGESTQDMNNTTTSFGPLVTVGVPWPKGLSDLAGFKTRPLFLGVSYDFLSSRKYDAAAKARRLDKLQDKLTLEAGTLITISDKEIEFTYRAVYQVRMPVPKADVPRWADFIAIRFGLFDLSGIGMTNGKFSLVYSHGMLAPVYERGHALGGGFYLKF